MCGKDNPAVQLSNDHKFREKYNAGKTTSKRFGKSTLLKKAIIMRSGPLKLKCDP